MVNAEELAQEFGYKLGVILSAYLRLSLDTRFKDVKNWDDLEEWLQR